MKHISNTSAMSQLGRLAEEQKWEASPSRRGGLEPEGQGAGQVGDGIPGRSTERSRRGAWRCPSYPQSW